MLSSAENHQPYSSSFGEATSLLFSAGILFGAVIYTNSSGSFLRFFLKAPSFSLHVLALCLKKTYIEKIEKGINKNDDEFPTSNLVDYAPRVSREWRPHRSFGREGEGLIEVQL